MSSRRAATTIGFALALGGCSVPLTYSRFQATAPYSSAPLPDRAKIFLIAGGPDVANFAAEIVAQRRMWRAHGYADDEIACYWARPTTHGFRHDRAQYREHAEALRPCFPASTAVVREHLARAASRDLPFVYLYVTTHGLTSLIPEDVPKDLLEQPDAEMLDQYALQLGAGPGWGVHPERLMTARRAGAAVEDLVFSPAMLRRALLQFPAATPKRVVLQACHAGGFADALAEVPNLIGLAAARFDRTSFGCDPGREMTTFGEVFLGLLTAALDRGPLLRLDWGALFVALQAEIAAAERRLAATPSLPVFLSGRQ